jgi:hypothetical protein
VNKSQFPKFLAIAGRPIQVGGSSPSPYLASQLRLGGDALTASSVIWLHLQQAYLPLMLETIDRQFA